MYIDMIKYLVTRQVNIYLYNYLKVNISIY